MKERLFRVLSQVLKSEVDENTSQKNCSNWDSLHHLNLIVELEIEFDVSFEPEEIGAMKSVAVIEKILKEKL